tara:strand:+ start:274 stop:1182 length:909 start_codon:yes stop_codon:yes gene_type:complete
MAIIPNEQKFHTVSSTVDTTDKGSYQANSMREVYTMQDIKESAIDGPGDKGQILTSGGPGNLPSFNIDEGTSGQVLTSNGPNQQPSFKNGGVSRDSINIEPMNYLDLQGIFLEEKWTIVDANYGIVVESDNDQYAINEMVAVPNMPGMGQGLEFTTPIIFGVGGYYQYGMYNNFDVSLNPFKYSEFTTGGGPNGWACGTINVGDPKYIWDNIMVATHGYPANDPDKPRTQSRFIGQVICANGIVPIPMARYITCDVSNLGSANLAGWNAELENYSLDTMEEMYINKITIYFSGNTSDVTIII